jgi:hypothetical protein
MNQAMALGYILKGPSSDLHLAFNLPGLKSLGVNLSLSKGKKKPLKIGNT